MPRGIAADGGPGNLRDPATGICGRWDAQSLMMFIQCRTVMQCVE